MTGYSGPERRATNNEAMAKAEEAIRIANEARREAAEALRVGTDAMHDGQRHEDVCAERWKAADAKLDKLDKKLDRQDSRLSEFAAATQSTQAKWKDAIIGLLVTLLLGAFAALYQTMQP